MSKSSFTLLLLFLADSISMSGIEKWLVCEHMFVMLLAVCLCYLADSTC
jgi:hypothetical protein